MHIIGGVTTQHLLFSFLFKPIFEGFWCIYFPEVKLSRSYNRKGYVLTWHYLWSTLCQEKRYQLQSLNRITTSNPRWTSPWKLLCHYGRYGGYGGHYGAYYCSHRNEHYGGQRGHRYSGYSHHYWLTPRNPNWILYLYKLHRILSDSTLISGICRKSNACNVCFHYLHLFFKLKHTQRWACYIAKNIELQK